MRFFALLNPPAGGENRVVFDGEVLPMASGTIYEIYVADANGYAVLAGVTRSHAVALMLWDALTQVHSACHIAFAPEKIVAVDEYVGADGKFTFGYASSNGVVYYRLIKA